MLNSGESINLVYDQEFDFRKGNLIEVSDDFLDYMDRYQQFLISGNVQDDMILSTDEKTYKLRGINLPTSMLLVSQKGTVDLQLSNFIKLEDYDHQYHKIYAQIKEEAPQEQDFQSESLDQLTQKFGISDQQVRDKFKISLKQFSRFEQFLDMFNCNGKRLFLPINILLKYMRSLLLFLTKKQLINQFFNQSILDESLEVNIKDLLDCIAKRFHFDIQQPNGQKMEIQTNQIHSKNYKVTYQTILHFIILQLSIAKGQYVASQMDDIIKGMIDVYIPLGMELPSQEQRKTLMKKVIARYFIQTTKNNTLLRIYYDPLQTESSLKGRIKFMANFKNRFTREQIRGIFEGLIIRQTSKQIKQVGQAGGRKSIDLDDLLLKNFRKFNQFYQIKLILPK